MMKKGWQCLFSNICIAIAYCLVGKLSSLLAIPPGFASPIWFSAGIALAGVLLGGYRCLPGVFLGSFCINLLIAFEASGSIADLMSCMTAAGIALGATLQAFISAYVIKRYGIDYSKLTQEKQIFQMLFLGGPVGCLINALIGPAILFCAGFITVSGLALSVFMWWVGDVIGVILCAPFILIIVGRNITLTRKLIVSVPLLLLCIVVIIVFSYVRNIQQQANQSQLATVAGDYAERIQRQIIKTEEVLHSIRRFYHASQFISRDEFKIYVSSIFDEQNGLQALEWVPYVMASQRTEFENQAKKDGLSEFKFIERIDGKLVESKNKEEYFPIFYAEPSEKNKKILGFDLGSDEVRKQVLYGSLDSGELRASEKITLVQDSIGSAQGIKIKGILMFEPVYKNFQHPTNIDERRRTISGLVLGVFRVDDLINIALENVGHEKVNLYMYDRSHQNEDRALYGTIDKSAAFSTEIEITMADSKWGLIVTPTADFLQQNSDWNLWLILVGGLLFSGVFGAFLLIISAQMEEVQRNLYCEDKDNKKSSVIILPLMSASLIIALTIIIYIHILHEEHDDILNLVSEKQAQVQRAIDENVRHAVVGLRRMAQRWEYQNGTPEKEWRADISHYLQDTAALTTIEWVDETYHVRWVEPQPRNEKEIGLNIAFNAQCKEIFVNAIAKDTIALSPLLDLVQGYRGYIAYTPLYIKNELKGYMVGVFNADEFLKRIITEDFKNTLVLRITDGSKTVYYDQSGLNEVNNKWGVENSLKLYNRHLKIAVEPKQQFLTSQKSVFPYLVLLGGLLVSLLGGFVIYYAAIARQRSNLLKYKSVALSESEAQFRSAMEFSAVGMALVSLDGKWLKINKSLSKIVGYAEDELLKIDFQTITHPDDLAKDLKLLQETVESKRESYQIEKRYINKEGSIVWVMLNVSLVRNVDETPKYFISQIQDISDRKAAEEKVLELTKRLTLIFEHVGEGIYGLDTQGYTIFANRAAEEILGYKLEEMRHVSQHDLIHYAYPDGERYHKDDCQIYAALKDGRTHTEDKDVFWHKEGYPVPVEYTSTPIQNDDGYISGAVVVFRDISDRKVIEEERMRYTQNLEEAREAALRANMMKSEFLANMSHEIRTPLNGIIGAADLLKKTAISGEQQKYLQVITGSGDNLLALINDILDLSKIEAGELNLNPEPLDIRELIEHVVSSISPRAISKNIELIVNFEGNIPASVLADPVRLNQIMINLLGNAVKFVESGFIAVHIVEKNSHNNLITLRITVEDSGIGIPSDKLEKIFEKFEQADSTTTKKYGGTGLGLAITKRLVELMQGIIGVQSEEGVGTSFWFEVIIPVLEWEHMNNTQDQAGSNPKETSLGISEDAEEDMVLNAYILLVENELVNQMVATDMLEGMGCRVELAENGVEALDMMADTANSYDIVLMDCMMPLMDGFDATLEQRKREDNDITLKKQTIIAMTANAMSDEKGRCFDVGMDDYLSKPVKARALYNKIKEYLK